MMKKFLCGTVAAVMCISCGGCGGFSENDVQTITCLAEPNVTYVSEPVVPDYAVEEITGYFDYALLKETVSEENSVISPMSVRLALNMAALGAKNDTETELLTLLGYNNSDDMRENSRSVISELDREDGSITVNNSVWVDSGYEIGQNYTADLADIFGAETFREKLADKKIVKKLNGWIDEKTKGLIPNMISEPFGADTALLLVNALYFKNEWEHEFDPFYEGYKMTFHGVNGDSETAGMSLEGKDIYYGEGSVFRSVRLYYKDGSYMNVYLPKNEDEDVLDIIGRLTPQELAQAMDVLDILYSNEMESDRTVMVVMPKFECEYNESLKETLQKMGMTNSFSDGADFGGMLDLDTYDFLHISDVIHAAKLECNEKGTEAAAATIVVVEEGSAVIQEEPPIEFIADKPFIYEIKSPGGETLFIGTVCGF